MNSERLLIYDTTLRDGEQCPGASMNLREKMEVARQLARLGVDVIEAGFPVISQGDFEAVSAIAREVRGPIITGLARCVPKDIEAAARAIKPAGKRGRIHVFLGTSKIHRQFKFGKARDEILRLAVEGVKLARKYCRNVQFSPEDGSRTELDFLTQIVEAAISAGATTINIPDTVGYATPKEYGAMFAHVIANARGARDVVFSAHCHDDLGMAVANSLSAVQNGVRQVEGTINGIGERAGNAALEEVIMALRTRRDAFTSVEMGVNVREIMRTSRLVSRMCGFVVQRNKAIVGENAFAHSAGIHQDGILKKRETYEIMNPEEIGWGVTELPLTKHSGRHALALRLKHLGYRLTDRDLNAVFARFKALGDKKKFVYDDDLGTLVDERAFEASEVWSLDYLSVTAGTGLVPTATVRLKKRAGTSGAPSSYEDAGTGDGPVDAALKTIDRITDRRGKLLDYQLRAVSAGKDAIGEVTIKADFGKGLILTGKGASTDIIEASARAYLNAVNRTFACSKRIARAASGS
ncbi:MAG: 2-isopropylmalate synthase [Verrucomicrobiae bacterium]|nr:2-isopropylmalate synthase [Verrucomicrobiae bacterium]